MIFEFICHFFSVFAFRKAGHRGLSGMIKSGSTDIKTGFIPDLHRSGNRLPSNPIRLLTDTENVNRNLAYHQKGVGYEEIKNHLS
jgi:hypothetical protein